MKVLVTGATGLIGQAVAKEVIVRGHSCIGTGRDSICRSELLPEPAKYRSLDITDKTAVDDIMRNERPDAVINCAGWTMVDAAEADENRSAAYLTNAIGPGNLAVACKECGATLIHLSTDYVFDGHGQEPWGPECTQYGPLNYYGETKLEGEQAVAAAMDNFYIVRISCVFGPGGANFINAILNAAKKYPELKVVDDQIGTPTYSIDLARLLVDMAQTDRFGYYHVTNPGPYVSRFKLAEEALRLAGCDINVKPVSSREYGSPAARPVNSRMDLGKIEREGFRALPGWGDALKRFIDNYILCK